MKYLFNRRVTGLWEPFNWKLLKHETRQKRQNAEGAASAVLLPDKQRGQQRVTSWLTPCSSRLEILTV